jgi:hypothetical protein
MSHHTSHLSPQVRNPSGLSQAPATQPTAVRSVSNDDIASRAYQKYEARGRVDGFDWEDWTSASRELAADTFGHLSNPSLSPSQYPS